MRLAIRETLHGFYVTDGFKYLQVGQLGLVDLDPTYFNTIQAATTAATEAGFEIHNEIHNEDLRPTNERTRRLLDRIQVLEETRRFLGTKYAGQCNFAADDVHQLICVERMTCLVELDKLCPGQYPLHGSDIFPKGDDNVRR